MLIPNTYEEFGAMVQRGIPASWKRAQEVKNLVTSTGASSWPDPFVFSMVFGQAASSYVMGLDLPAMMLASTASESLLRNALDEWNEGGLGFKRLIEMAESHQLISREMADRLSRLREKVRNVVAHGHRQLSLGFVGMKHVDVYEWEARDDETALPFKEAALNTLETYMLLVVKIG